MYEEMQLTDSEMIRDWLDFALGCNDVSCLSSMIRVRWNKRFTRKFADAGYGTCPPRGRIRISPMIWERATREQRRETLIHEACHIVAYHLHGLAIKPHGIEWRQAMVKCGVEPVVTHNIDLVGINFFHVRECTKANRCHVSRRDFAALKRGGLLQCTICGMQVDAASIELTL
ncbi:SprT-like domain-containing protein [Bremerella sp. JC817]|uniref:SprT family zinc-dependent metalloprotease n=1 Tax=Bremerella sp. JC817 TaxID=3231756 RepID=UPI003458F5D6